MTETAGATWHLAQATVSRLRYPADDPRVAEFFGAVDRVNRLAEASPGYVWRYAAGSGHATAAGDDRTVVTLSLWEDYPALRDFTYRTLHGEYLRRRHEWFEPTPRSRNALWWIPADGRPTLTQALARVTFLDRYGPTARAFTVQTRFRPDGRREAAPPRRPGRVGLAPASEIG